MAADKQRQDAGPLVDDDVQGGVKQMLTRLLERATPDTWVAGGGSDDRFSTNPRNHAELKQRETIYRNGGPVTEFVDTRALMTYGTGVEFQSQAPNEDAQGRTVDEWLADQFGDTLELTMIDAGIQSYWAGDAWPKLVEDRAGDFSHLELVDPTTVNPEYDIHGELIEIEQIITTADGKRMRQSLDVDLVGHFTFRDSCGGPLGDSLIEQNKDEIERYLDNQEQRANAIELHGSPKYDVSVGSEGQSIPDKVMRFIDRKFRPERIDEQTTWTHGGDIEIETLDSPGMGEGMKTITETDLALLAGAFGIPLEWTNFGSAGLGEGTPAESRILKFERQARAEQTRRANQFLRDIVRPLLERYSPFPRDIEVTVKFGDVVSDPNEVVSWLSQVDWAFHRDEIRELLGREPWPDAADDDREAPPEMAPSAQDGGGLGDGGGLFSDRDQGRGDGRLNGRGSGQEQRPSAAATAAGPTVADGSGAIGAQAQGDNPGEGQGNASTLVADDHGCGGRALIYENIEEDQLEPEEMVWLEVVDSMWAWDDDPSRRLFEFDPSDLPQFVVEDLKAVIPSAIAESSLSTLSDEQVGFLSNALGDALEDEHGWSLESIQRHIDEIPGVDLERWKRERIGRDLTQNAVGKAREENYRERENFEELRFDWVGPDDRRTTQACEWIKAQIPDEGVSMDRLKALIQEANDRFVDHAAREWSAHVQCRHQPVRTIDS